MMLSKADNRKRPPVNQASDGIKRQKASPKCPSTLRRLTGFPQDFTRVSDEVHRTIDFCPVVKAFKDTPQFQRLRSVKQLGTSHYVYPSANHTRFEHSLGVSHLANALCRRIKERQPYLGATDKDVLCVTLAGLLHDIGHGPFSHIYEEFRGEIDEEIKSEKAVKQAYKQFPSVDGKEDHETSSLMMIDAALKHLGLEIDFDNLDEPLKQIGDGSPKNVDARSMRVFNHTGRDANDCDDEDILTSRDFIFIKECIWGEVEGIEETKTKLGTSGRIGRMDPRKEWLYDIVANRYSGLDVDKLDYFARDTRRSLGEAGIINIPMAYEALVAKAECHESDCGKCANGRKGHYMICYPIKCVESVMEFFKTRYNMHHKVYQHKTTISASIVLCDALRAADLHYLMTSNGSQPVPISRAVLNADVYLKLNDSIIDLIDASTSPELAEARDLTRRLLERDFYSKCKINCKKKAMRVHCRRRIVVFVLIAHFCCYSDLQSVQVNES
jgi:deoxynucleoside triphosphate triphosphohydrolase SAMHD1